MYYNELRNSTPIEIMKNLNATIGPSPKERQKIEEAKRESIMTKLIRENTWK